MTLEQARQFALSLPEATEEPHFEYTSFRIGGKIFATAPPGGEFLHLFVTDADREAALAQEPDFLEDLHWGKKIAGLRATLPAAKVKAIHRLLTQAWSRKASKRLRAAAALGQ